MVKMSDRIRLRFLKQALHFMTYLQLSQALNIAYEHEDDGTKQAVIDLINAEMKKRDAGLFPHDGIDKDGARDG